MINERIHYEFDGYYAIAELRSDTDGDIHLSFAGETLMLSPAEAVEIAEVLLSLAAEPEIFDEDDLAEVGLEAMSVQQSLAQILRGQAPA